MFPFWELVIGPIIESVGARRVVEIGALKGETTELMLEQLGPEAELHVIDPVPDFDPTEHETRFPGRYIFHRDLSHNVLGDLPPADVALIDGDHNWYTVYHELRLLAEVARSAGQPLPVLLMHDVGWPYGRRDLYYAPEQIPEEYRQPHAQRGMRPGRSRLLNRGGMNPTMHNALEEGGPRNGVMTALDDFDEGHDRALRRVVLPIYFGLAIVVEEERLAQEPELAATIARLETSEGREDLLRLAEDTRLRAMLFQHNVMGRDERQRQRVIGRYLDLLKGALVDEHYLENEARLRYLAAAIDRGATPSATLLREPPRHTAHHVRQVRQAQRQGNPTSGDVGAPFAYASSGRAHLDALQDCLDALTREGVAGDLLDCGTGRGGTSVFLRGWLDAHEISDRTVWVADPFRAAPEGEPPQPSGLLDPSRLLPDLAMVRTAFERFDLLDEHVRFLQGPFTDTLADPPESTLALVRIGSQANRSVEEILDAVYDRLTVGGRVVIEDHVDEAAKAGIEAFRVRRGITEPSVGVGPTGLMWQKKAEAPSTNGHRVTPQRRRAPLAPPAPTDRADLSVIVVFYNMGREAYRTLRSLSPSYQEGVTDLDYEVIAVENGSDPDQRLGEEFVSGFGPQFGYLDLGPEATPTPVDALNRGLQLARGDRIAFMIDGAHVLTPGVLHYAMAGLDTYAPAVAVTQQWYVGPGQQPEALAEGYDEGVEDRLFDQIEWPSDGYRLFDIGHFIGERDWLDGVWESNCIFAPRSLLEQVGAFDESFSMPGGGYANLELYERLGTSPDVTVVSMLGEGSFHQSHGGTTTNQVDPAERHRRVSSYGLHYAELRGRGFHGTGKPIHYVGALRPNSRRSKARRLIAPHFRNTSWGDAEGRPDTQAPMPQELEAEYLDAYWRNLAWQETSWLGHPVGKPANDLIAYQELLTRVRPDWIIETGTGNGGRAMFLASICDLLGAGQIISIGTGPLDGLPAHDRITYFRSRAFKPEMVQQVHDLVGDERALVVLGSRLSPPPTAKEFDSYSPLVPQGSYVVVEDTIVNGRPVWPGFGPGPAEGVKRILRDHMGEWAPDPTFERFGLTFNPGGFLRRL